jgi:hypothetical protein
LNENVYAILFVSLYKQEYEIACDEKEENDEHASFNLKSEKLLGHHSSSLF